jgi:hypothetical protein
MSNCNGTADLRMLIYLATFSTLTLAHLKFMNITRSPWNKDQVILLPICVAGAIILLSYGLFFFSLIISIL